MPRGIFRDFGGILKAFGLETVPTGSTDNAITTHVPSWIDKAEGH